MSYQSLYRRYRPRRFAEVRGQEHVKSALISAIRNGTVGHAYLFSGPRGTGKTTSARLLAKALNCIDLQEGEPCGVCESCVSMDAGRSYDLFELDAASNNGVEAMRDLIAKAAVGSPGATKVYILDEVHMLSTAASNALLKTLEEPPDHVKFVLATTDPQKVLPTIKSRTQHFSFELLNAAELEEYVRWILADQGRELSDEAVAHVVRLGRGSARDTVSALEQVLATGGVITAAATVDEVLDAIASEDVGAALSAVDQAIAGGRDPRVLAETIVAGLRDVFLASMGSVGAHLPPADLAKVEAWAGTLRPARCARALELLGHAVVEMRQAAEPRIPLEVAVIRLSQPSMDTSVDALLDRVERLEAQLAGAGPVSASTTSAGPIASAEASEVAESADRPTGSPAAGPRPQPPAVTRVPAQERPPSAQPPSGQPSSGQPPSAQPPSTPANGDPVGPAGPAEIKRRLAALKTTGNVTEDAPAPPAPPPRVRPARPQSEARPPESMPSASGPPAVQTPAGPTPAGQNPAVQTPAGQTSMGQPSVDESPRDQPSAAAAEATAGPPVAATPSGGGLTEAFSEAVHNRLRGRAKALFSGARVVDQSGNRLTIAFSNGPTMNVAEQHVGEVTEAVSAQAGAPVELVLVSDDDPTSRGSAARSPRGEAAPSGGAVRGPSAPQANTTGGAARRAPLDGERQPGHDRAPMDAVRYDAAPGGTSTTYQSSGPMAASALMPLDEVDHSVPVAEVHRPADTGTGEVPPSSKSDHPAEGVPDSGASPDGSGEAWPRPALRLVRDGAVQDEPSEEAELLAVNVDELEDAPNAQSASERIMAAFPGSMRVPR